MWELTWTAFISVLPNKGGKKLCFYLVTKLKYPLVSDTLWSCRKPSRPFINTVWMSSLSCLSHISNRSVTIAAGTRTTDRRKWKRKNLTLGRTFKFLLAPNEGSKRRVREVPRGNGLSLYLLRISRKKPQRLRQDNLFPTTNTSIQRCQWAGG